MLTINTKLYFIGFFVILSTPSCSAFFLNWFSQEQNQPQYYYHQRVLQSPVSYRSTGNVQLPTYTESVPLAIPAVPVKVPLEAQLTPSETIEHVQLVPCLCPVSQEKYQQESVFSKTTQST